MFGVGGDAGFTLANVRFTGQQICGGGKACLPERTGIRPETIASSATRWWRISRGAAPAEFRAALAWRKVLGHFW
jgi:hypothetical protein